MSTESNRDPLTDRLLKAALRPHERAVSDACLDAETLAAWADGSVSGEAASAIEAHLADCARCQSMLAVFASSASAESADLATAGMTETAARGAVIPFRPRSPMRWLVPVAAGAAAASLLIWIAWPRPGAPIVPAEQSMARTESVPVPTPLPPANRAQQPNPPVERSATSASPKLSRPAAVDALTVRKAEPAASPTGRTAETLQKPATPAASPRYAPPPPAPVATAAGAPATALPRPAPIAPPQATGRAVSDVVTVTAAAELVRTEASATSVVLEFKPPEMSTPAVGQAMAARGAGRGGGAAGGARTVADPPIPASLIRWRVLASGQAMKSTDGGVTWHPVAIETGVQITNGAAPSASVCWLVGRRGVVLLSTDAMRFARVSSPDAADLTAIIAVDANQATVTTVDGRVFKTTDGGKTWQ